MRRARLLGLAMVVSLLAVSAEAGAAVLDLGSAGRFGVAPVPGTSIPSPPVIPTSAPPCSDPWLASDLSLPDSGLCYRGGPVIHSNETFALTWDPLRRYWQTTRDYVEQFLSNVAGGSGTLSSPYAVTSQYRDAGGRAANVSLYGGGCIDFGGVGGSSCKLGNASGTGAGHSYPASGCPVTGISYGATNDVCLTDQQLRTELSTMINQTALVAGTKPGYTPLLVLLTPPGVETCLDGAGTVCSANSGAAARFCSYHSQVTVGGTKVAYVVQPWTPYTGCDEPDVPPLPTNPTAQQLAIDVGARLVSPLSQGEIATIVNPALNGWYALNGAEIDDNGGCVPLGNHLDEVIVGGGGYLLQREFSNAGVIESDPNAPACARLVALTPTFVVPSAVNPGDVVQFDGSTTVSSLIVPNADYRWSFGDGTSATGASVVHSYAKGGSYNVTLFVTDRGGHTSALSQTITVLGAGGQTQPQPHNRSTRGLRARLQLVPQGLGSMLRYGVALRVTSNKKADGIATLSISRKVAKRAHIRTGRGKTVVIGRGTVSGIRNGTVKLHLRLSRTIKSKLGHMGHVTVTVRLTLFASGGDHVAIDAAGRY